jgi:hypothetical protein
MTNREKAVNLKEPCAKDRISPLANDAKNASDAQAGVYFAALVAVLIRAMYMSAQM